MALICCTECSQQFSDRADACPSCGMHTEDILYETNEEYRDHVEMAHVAYHSVDSLYNTIAFLGFAAVVGVGALWVLQPSMDSTLARVIMFGGAITVAVSQVMKRMAENRIEDELARRLSSEAPEKT